MLPDRSSLAAPVNRASELGARLEGGINDCKDYIFPDWERRYLPN